MTLLILGSETSALVQPVIDYAEAHRFTLEVMKHKRDSILPIGEDPGFSCVLPVDFRCVYSIEEHPSGWCRHLSVSISTPRRLPTVPAMEAIMGLFGFKRRLDKPDSHLNVYLEERSPTKKAINIMELYL